MVTEPTFEWDDAKDQSNQVKHGGEKGKTIYEQQNR